MAPLAFGE